MAEVSITSTDTTEGKILGKFENQGELEKAYQELEKKLGAGFASTSQQPLTEEPKASELGAVEEAGEVEESPYGDGLVQAVSSVGLDINTLAEQWNTTGDLDEASKTKLSQVFGEDVVNSYLQGVRSGTAQQEAIATQTEQEVLASVGGQAAFDTIADWAGGPNGDKSLTDAFNMAIDTGNGEMLKVAALALKASYEASNGSLGHSSVLKGQAPVQASGEGYHSRQEMLDDFQNPRYQTDSAFREAVGKKMKFTKGLEVNG